MSKKTPMIMYSYEELAAALVKDQNLHSGMWKIALKFGQPGGLQARFQQYPNKPLIPSAIVPVLSVMLVEANPAQDSGLMVDAGVVNPGLDEVGEA